MKWINQVVAQRTNATVRPRGWGALWGGRFKNKIVADDEYWMELLAYLHMNPVRAGVVHIPGLSRRTSHAAYTGAAPRPSWLTTGELLDLFGTAASLANLVAHKLKRLQPTKLWPSRRSAIPDTG